LTPAATSAMLAAMPLAAVLALGGLIITLIVVCGIGLVVLTVISLWKMRKDDFWDKTEY
jgi:hypothetical protein